VKSNIDLDESIEGIDNDDLSDFDFRRLKSSDDCQAI
jgi:hypothetical protein